MSRSVEVQQLSSIMYAFMASIVRLGAGEPLMTGERAVRAALEHNQILKVGSLAISNIAIVESFAVATLSSEGDRSYTILRSWHGEWEIVLGTIKECIREDLLISYGMQTRAAEKMMRMLHEKIR